MHVIYYKNRTKINKTHKNRTKINNTHKKQNENF